MLLRLETMVLFGAELPLLAIRQQIVSGIDVMIHLSRMQDKSRKVLEIVEVDALKNGEIQLRPLYQRDAAGELKKVEPLKHTQKLELSGIRWEGIHGL